MNVYVLMLLAALATGLRTFTPLAALCWRAGNWTSIASIVFALGELIADKLPAAPSRTQIFSLALRCCVSAYVVNAIGSAAGVALLYSVVVAIVGAVAGAYLGYGWRMKAAPAVKIPPLIAALLEDAVAIVVAVWVFFGAH